MSQTSPSRPKLKRLPDRVARADLSIAKTAAVYDGKAEPLRGNTTARGYGWKWQQAREGFLRKNPLCAFCERKGRAVAANVVDHIEPHKGDMTLFWDRKNWQPLCTGCHSSTKQREERALGTSPR